MERIGGRKARLADVAEKAGVSKATASNVFNRPELVRKEVRERVRAAAEEIGYAGPDPKGRMLSAGKVNAIGVATAEPLGYFFEDPYSRTMMKGISEICDANGIGISLISGANEDALAWSIRSALVDGLILFCLEDTGRLVVEARERRLPFVALDLGDTDPTVPAVGIDDVAGARLAAEHLAALGHRRFAVLAMEFGEGPGGRVDMSRVEGAAYAVSRDRVLGYFAALAAAGIDTAGVPVFETNADPTSVDRAMEELFGAGERPTALLAQSDRIAMRALEWLKVRGIAVPGEVSVTGFDGVPEGEATLPPLTTVRQPIRELGRRAVELILDPGPGVRRERLEVDLVVRGSTASPAS